MCVGVEKKDVGDAVTVLVAEGISVAEGVVELVGALTVVGGRVLDRVGVGYTVCVAEGTMIVGVVKKGVGDITGICPGSEIGISIPKNVITKTVSRIGPGSTMAPIAGRI